MYISNRSSKEKRSRDKKYSNDELIIKIDDISDKIEALKVKIGDNVRKHVLYPLDNFIRLYDCVVSRVLDVVTYLNDVISAMKELGFNYENKYDVCDRLDRWHSAETDGNTMYVLNYYRRDINRYIDDGQYDDLKKINNLLEKIEKFKGDILDKKEVKTSHNRRLVSKLEGEFKCIKERVDFKMDDIFDNCDCYARNNRFLKKIDDLVDCIRDIERDESLTNLRSEYKRRFTMLENKSDPNIDEKANQLEITPSNLPNSLIICNSQERVIYALKSSLGDKYSSINPSSIYDLIDPLKDVSISLDGCKSINDCIIAS